MRLELETMSPPARVFFSSCCPGLSLLARHRLPAATALGPTAATSQAVIPLHSLVSKRAASSSSSSSSSSKAREIDQLGSWHSRDDFSLGPISEDSSIQRGTVIPKISLSSIGVCTHRGRRSYQEDRYAILELPGNLLLLAVFDGHGGAECSEFCQETIESKMIREIDKAKERGKRLDLGATLRKVVADLNASFAMRWDHKKNRPSSGTTATIALIRDGYELVVAQVGDSRAILCRDSSAKCLTKDHCPSDPKERARIESRGGTVTYDTIGRYMVNQRLAMSRSIGDLDLKQYGVISDPDVIRKNIRHVKDEFLVLTSDGINFVMTDDEVVECIRAWPDPSEASEKLIDQALLYASEDNVTVIILPLGAWGKGDSANTSVLYSLGRNMALSSRFS